MTANKKPSKKAIIQLEVVQKCIADLQQALHTLDSLYETNCVGLIEMGEQLDQFLLDLNEEMQDERS